MEESTSNKATAAAKSAATKAKAAASAAADVVPTSTKDVRSTARDAAYTVVGLGVMGLNKAQSQARQLVDTAKSKDLIDRLESLRVHVGNVAKATTDTVGKADEKVESVITKVEERIQPYEDRLPDQARDVVRRARETGRETRAKVRAKVLSS